MQVHVAYDDEVGLCILPSAPHFCYAFYLNYRFLGKYIFLERPEIDGSGRLFFALPLQNSLSAAGLLSAGTWPRYLPSGNSYSFEIIGPDYPGWDQ